ncbi:MAG: M28 family peptidase [Clostridium sp.]
MKRLISLIMLISLLTSCSPLQSTSTKNKPSITIDEKRIYSNLETICRTPRPYGSEGETKASQFIKDTLTKLNYNVEITSFPVYRQTSSSPLTKNINEFSREKLGDGKNIIVKNRNYNKSKKSIYITAHYDTTKNTVGVMDNGSGTATVLEIATVLKDYNPDFNIVYVFFGAEEYFKVGSKNFLLNLSEEERSNIIGAINLDMIGEKDAGPLEIRTFDYFDNVLSYEFNSSLPNKLQYGMGSSSDDLSFFAYKIPTFTLADDNPNVKRSFEPDHIKYIDTTVLKSAGESICNFLINLEPNKLKPLSGTINGNTKAMTILTDYKSNRKIIPLPKGFKYSNSTVEYVENGYLTRINYIYKSDAKEFKISTSVTPDYEILSTANYKSINPNNKDPQYYVINEGEKFSCSYLINHSFGDITGDITLDEAMEILKYLSK